MKIIQFSDTHLRADGRLSFHKMDTMTSLMRTIDHFENMTDQPDFYICTGDLGDKGNVASYKVMNEMFKRLPRPVYIVPGNHDNSEALNQELSTYIIENKELSPQIGYVIEKDNTRIIVVETIDQGEHWGCLTLKVASWLEKTILEDTEILTIVFTHHPPFTSGLPVMDEPFGNIDELERILKLHNNLTLCTGHLHRACFTTWKGIPTMTCPPIAMLIELDFSPEGGDRFYLSDPTFLIHRIENGEMTSYVDIIPTNATYSGPHKFTYLENEERKDR